MPKGKFDEMKKTWIKVKRGLLSPAHRTRMGARIWLFLYMLDRADWETGIVYGWIDREEAKDFGMQHRTLTDQRQQLEKDGYIVCVQRQRHQDIKMVKWTDPRKYDGVMQNEGDIQGDTEGNIQGSRKFRTPTSKPHNTSHTSLEPVYEDLEPKPKRMPKKIQNPLVKAIADVTDTDLTIKGNFSWLSKYAKGLWEGDYTPEDVYNIFGEGGSWFKKDWRGQKGQLPTPPDVPRNIKKYGKSVYVPPEKDDRDFAEMQKTTEDTSWMEE